jgi:hypothetical protein
MSLSRRYATEVEAMAAAEAALWPEGDRPTRQECCEL